MNIDGFISHLRTRSYSNGTIVAYRSELQQFEKYLREAKLRVNQVKPIHIEKYLRWRDPKTEHQPATTRRRLAALSSFYDFVGVMANGHIRNPVRPLRRPRRQPPRPKPLDEKQVAVLAEGVHNARDAAIIALLLHSGLRVSELCSLNRNSITIEHLDANLSGKVVGVGRVLGKGRKEREFLVNRPAMKLVHEYLLKRGSDDIDALFLSNRRRRIDPRTIQHMLHAWCKRLNLPPLHPHQLRATFGTRLNRVGVPILDISTFLGHLSAATTMAYVKPDARRMRTEYFAAHEKLNSSL